MIGDQIHEFAKELWPIDRSLTGVGVRQTIKKIQEILPQVKLHEIKSGTSVFDWTVPKEWKVNDAYIITPSGEKICQFKNCNLHLVGYSVPFHGKLSFTELKKYLYFLTSQPSAIPYVTSYYQERWGFCLSYEEFNSLKDGVYTVEVDTELFDGNLNYGELILPGNKQQEIFLSSYICHPSLANNELSGPTVLTFIADWLQKKENLEYTYRIVFLPETIGSIAYLSRNLDEMKSNTVAGFNVTCIGDDREYSYLPSRTGESLSDRAAKHVLSWTDENYRNYSWLDRGSDERQYCSPGVDLPIASIMRSKYGTYPEYHTSLDDLENVVTPAGLEGGYWALRRTLEAIENNKRYKLNTFGEPQLGRRGLYNNLSIKGTPDQSRIILNFLSYCDGHNDLIEIATKLSCPIWDLYPLIEILKQQNLINLYEN